MTYDVIGAVFADVMSTIGVTNWWELVESDFYEGLFIPTLAKVLGLTSDELSAMPEFVEFEREMYEDL